ncbi:hypothetical protein DL771_006938 [Monosporascus sp. 5C6A]|nr:hypothetical protein DL771_006938 [Monosporascus sp. 5C6A]
MELYATGFNAWRQLEFNDLSGPSQEPDDIQSFRSVLKDRSVIDRPYAFLACTFVWHEEEKLVKEYSSLSLAEIGQAQASYPGLDGIVQLVAYETGFAALSMQGDVMTWGDERYAASLGREVTQESPAEYPGAVRELEELPTGKIKKIVAGGYVLLGLTEGNDLYAWGGHPGRPALIEGISGSPTPVIVEEHDVTDCALGESHMIILTEGGDVYVIGDNTNGQLGLPVRKTTSWTKAAIPLTAGQSVVAVVAGPRSSFILTKYQIS